MSKPIEIFSGTPWEAAMLKSLLEREDVEAFLKDDIMGTFFPWHSSPGGVSPIKIIISSVDFEKAKKIVEEFQKNAAKE